MTRTELLKIAKPILFNGEMVRALLDGRKTVTRRVVKNASPEWEFEDWCDCAVQTIIDRNGNEKAKDVDGLWATFNAFDEYIEFPMIKSRYNVGDYLYVRETFCEVPYEYESVQINGWHITMPKIAYKADSEVDYTGIWKPSIHMPKGAARIFLRVTGVRVERLQDITPDGIWAEGTSGIVPYDAFERLWNSTIKLSDIPEYGWEANPWVWVYEFEGVVAE